MDLRRLTPALAVAAQLVPSDVRAAAAAGYTTLICNRPDGEQPGQPSHEAMAQAAAAAGMRFVFQPVISGRITTEQARARGRAPREALDEVASVLVATWRAGIPVVAFNAGYDLSLLDAELDRHGLPTVPQRLGRAAGPVIDPLVLDRAEERYRPGKRRLGDLCAVYGVATPDALHAAHVDVVATLDLLDAMVARFPHLAELDLATLQAYQVHAHLSWAESFNAWRGERGLPGPGAELDWPVRTMAPARQAV